MSDLSTDLKNYEEVPIDGKLYIFKHLNSYDKAAYVREFRKRCKAQKLENLKTSGATPPEIAVELDAFDADPPQMWWAWTGQDADAPLIACRMSLAKTYPSDEDIGAKFGNGNPDAYGSGKQKPEDLVMRLDLGFKNVRTIKVASCPKCQFRSIIAGIAACPTDGTPLVFDDEMAGDNEMTELLKALFGKWLLIPKPFALPDTTNTSTYGDGGALPNADSPGPTYGTPATTKE